MKDMVHFGIPLDVCCALCGHCFRLGCPVDATKKILTVSESGVVTWLFSFSCADPLCPGMLEFSSAPSRNPRFVARGDAALVRNKAQSQERVQRVFEGERDAMKSSSKPVYPRCGLRERNDEARKLEALMRRQSHSYADNVATVNAISACVAERWDATPSRPVARDKVGKELMRRKEARKLSMRIKRESKTALACQRAAVGRMSRPQFAAARFAVRSLHRGGALCHVVSASKNARKNPDP